MCKTNYSHLLQQIDIQSDLRKAGFYAQIQIFRNTTNYLKYLQKENMQMLVCNLP